MRISLLRRVSGGKLNSFGRSAPVQSTPEQGLSFASPNLLERSTDVVGDKQLRLPTKLHHGHQSKLDRPEMTLYASALVTKSRTCASSTAAKRATNGFVPVLATTNIKISAAPTYSCKLNTNPSKGSVNEVNQGIPKRGNSITIAMKTYRIARGAKSR